MEDENSKFNVIDFGVYSLKKNNEPSTEEFENLAKTLTEELKKNGVALLANTGYEDDLKDEAWEIFDKFRELPDKTKAKYGAIPDVRFRLQVPLYTASNTDRYGNREIDSVESINLFPMCTDIVYPEAEVRGYAETLRRLFDHHTAIQLRVLECLSSGMGLGKDRLKNVVKGLMEEEPFSNSTQLRLNLYSPWSILKESKRTRARFSEHVDPTIITLLRSDEPGLQIQTREGKWVDVPCIPNTLVVFFGSSIQHLFGKTFHAPAHQVVYQKDKEMQRRSTITFMQPDNDVPIPNLLDDKSSKMTFQKMVESIY